MKRITNLFSILALAAVVFVSSCGKKDDPKPVEPNPDVVLVMNNTTPASKEYEVWTSQTVKIQVQMSSNSNMRRLYVTRQDDGGTVMPVNISSNDQGWTYNTSGGYYEIPSSVNNSATITFTVNTRTSAISGASEDKYTFTATDNAGTPVTLAGPGVVTLKYVNNTTPVGGEINTYSAKIMGGAANTTVGSFFKSATGDVVKAAEANSSQSSIDLIFQYSGTNGNLFAAPNDATIADAHTNVASWSVKNATKFTGVLSVTASEFNSASNDVLINSNVTTSNATGTRINSLAVGNVFGFITASGKKGLVLVKEIGGTTAETRSITIDVKVQK
ncbi:MAG: hypothetical protein ACK40G_10670 [Cytophagaceae bacterium]